MKNKSLLIGLNVLQMNLYFRLPEGKKGFHGSIDMMAGSITFKKEEFHLSGIIIKHKSEELVVKGPHYVEAKPIYCGKC